MVFVDHTECYWLKWLKPGFRHCFAAVRAGNTWVVCDSLKDRMEILPVNLLALQAGVDLPSLYAEQGYVVLVGNKSRTLPDRRLTIELLTCVTVTKRLLGLRSSSICTPWQLFCFLINQRRQNEAWQLVSPYSDEKVNFQLDI